MQVTGFVTGKLSKTAVVVAATTRPPRKGEGGEDSKEGNVDGDEGAAGGDKTAAPSQGLALVGDESPKYPQLIVVTGFYGAGKTSIIKAVLARSGVDNSSIDSLLNHEIISQDELVARVNNHDIMPVTWEINNHQYVASYRKIINAILHGANVLAVTGHISAGRALVEAHRKYSGMNAFVIHIKVKLPTAWMQANEYDARDMGEFSERFRRNASKAPSYDDFAQRNGSNIRNWQPGEMKPEPALFMETLRRVAYLVDYLGNNHPPDSPSVDVHPAYVKAVNKEIFGQEQPHKGMRVVIPDEMVAKYVHWSSRLERLVNYAPYVRGAQFQAMPRVVSAVITGVTIRDGVEQVYLRPDVEPGESIEDGKASFLAMLDFATGIKGLPCADRNPASSAATSDLIFAREWHNDRSRQPWLEWCLTDFIQKPAGVYAVKVVAAMEE